ncbi:hypothetical protein OLX02_09485 [Novosphingobium sp. KCTC 2891]|uniref:hypothetical protein n=1 Tax=Novosphingobium sp. KCTC 2891 TaxID=2989730 RepID=UPI00222138B9|nr:hypothetical protein [Novosphingobium sp. KCTC 2891]MCW1383053.1 hypothetical protein [Novosphingobium sp. KCTC 2891]
MRFAVLFVPLLALAAPALAKARKPAPAVAAQATPIDLTGRYRVDQGPDVAGDLVLTADRHFEYRLAAGALDEEASGTWAFVGGRTCLTTTPKPVPPVWQAVPATKGPTVRVVWPGGEGISGVGVRIGFDSGELDGGYTLEDGWSLPPGEHRMPRWVELEEPVHDLVSPRFTFGGSSRLVVTLVPNDLGKVDFDGACIDLEGTGLLLHRGEGVMRFYRFDP